MATNGRWEKPHEDARDRPTDNKYLAHRGEFSIPRDVSPDGMPDSAASFPLKGEHVPSARFYLFKGF